MAYGLWLSYGFFGPNLSLFRLMPYALCLMAYGLWLMAYGFSLMASSFSHTPVLAAETLKLLDPQPGQTVVDCTAGRGGHSLLLAGAVGPRGRVLGFDVDPGNLTCAAGRLEQAGLPYTAVCENFVRAPRHLVSAGLRADVVLADLGFSSDQMDDPQRGLSFSADGPLDMRLDPDGPVTAAELVERCTEEELAEIISRYGEDPYARSIARNLARSRQREPIRSTAQLARLVEQTYGVGARPDVAGDQVDRPRLHLRFIQERANRRRNLTAVDHSFFKDPDPSDLPVDQEGRSPSRPGALNPQDYHASSKVYPEGGGGSSHNLQYINYKISAAILFDSFLAF